MSAVCMVAIVVAIIATPVGWTLFGEMSLLLIGGVGGLVIHEFAHAVAFQMAYPDASWNLDARSCSLRVVTDTSTSGLRQSLIAAAGPLAGAAASTLPAVVSTSPSVYFSLSAIHLALLTPLGADGRMFVAGLVAVRQ